MAIKDDAAFYGMSVFSASLGAAGALTLAEGKTFYGKSTFGPTGLLLRKVDSIQESLKYGGLLIVSTDRSKWQFYAGSTLVDVLGEKKLGWCASNLTDINDKTTILPSVYTRGKKVIVGESTNAGFFTWDAWGMHFQRPDPVAIPYWDANAAVEFFGIVTGCTFGYGQSHHRGGVALPHGGTSQDSYVRAQVSKVAGTSQFPIFSFMASEVPMRVPFGTFANNARDAMLETVPSKVRDYYARTFTQAVTPFANDRPSIRVHTVWKNGVLFESVPLRSAVEIGRSSSPNSARGVGFICNGALLSGVPHDEAGGKPSPWMLQLYAEGSKAYGTSGYSSSTPGMIKAANGAQGSVSFPGKTWATSDFGRNVPGTSLPQIVWSDDVNVPTRETLTGVMEGLAAGQLRDGHVLARALMDGQKYAKDVPLSQDVMAVIRSTLGKGGSSEYIYDLPDEATVQSMTEADSQTLLQAHLNARRIPTDVFDTGTLNGAMDAMISRWDSLAYALARAEN